MSLYQKPAGRAASRTEPAPPRLHRPMPRLNPMMACDTAFRVIARRYLADLTANHEATYRGDPTALHQMRIAVTRLRTAVTFFSPMVADNQQTQIKDQLKWLNSHLGAVRDLDVAIERLKALDKQQPRTTPYYRSWNAKRANGHRLLAQALRSARYRRLIETTSDWIESGPWSTAKGKQATKLRAFPIATYAAAKLQRWQTSLLKKSGKLLKMSTEKRHRLRLRNKKLSYSIEAFEDLFLDKKFSGQQAGLKYLRKAQRSLGQLNDDANSHALAGALQQDGISAPLQFLSSKREKRLLRTAAAAYRKLAALEQ
jgi:CHAD domain-containing protein